MNGHYKLAIALFLSIAPERAFADQPAPSDSSWVGDPRFSAIHDMYWRAQLQHRYAGNRICSLKDIKNYDDPSSPFRSLDQRLNAAGNRITTIWPGALNRVVRPYQMPPPQLLCDDPKSAWEAIFALETAVVALERFLDNASDKRATKAGGR